MKKSIIISVLMLLSIAVLSSCGFESETNTKNEGNKCIAKYVSEIKGQTMIDETSKETIYSSGKCLVQTYDMGRNILGEKIKTYFIYCDADISSKGRFKILATSEHMDLPDYPDDNDVMKGIEKFHQVSEIADAIKNQEEIGKDQIDKQIIKFCTDYGFDVETKIKVKYL